jgi:P27 family predicted phage terminase small subunit
MSSASDTASRPQFLVVKVKGRPRLSDAEKVARGTYRIDRQGLPTKAIELPDTGPAKPEGLCEVASAYWTEVVPDLVKAGLAKKIDGAELAQMCCWYAESIRLHKAMAECPVDVTWGGDDEDGDEDQDEPKGHYRLVMMAATADKQFRSIADKFGMNPADRSRLRIKPAETENELPARVRA